MKLILPGGSGRIGGVLARALARNGTGVVALSRNPGEDALMSSVAGQDQRIAGREGAV